jgi:hypothetical protein
MLLWVHRPRRAWKSQATAQAGVPYLHVRLLRPSGLRVRLKRGWQWVGMPEGKQLGAHLLAALLLRVVLVPFPGFAQEVPDDVAWRY